MRKADGVRAQLVEAAVRILAEEGPEAIQARRLTREIGASTMAVYHYFGGMPQLLRAISDEGFRRLDARLGTVRASDDPVTDIVRLAFAYRETARDNPHLYDLMFGLAAPGGHRPAPPPEHDDAEVSGAAPTPAGAVYQHLVDAASRAIELGRISPSEPDPVAAQLWSMLHGFVALELAGHFDTLADPIGQVLVPLGVNLLTGLGDKQDQALCSGAQALSEVTGREPDAAP